MMVRFVGKFFVLLFCFGVLGISFGGCVLKRSIVGLEEHPSAPVVLVDTVDTIGLIEPFAIDRQRQWRCIENAETLTCKLSCDGFSDYACAQNARLFSAGGRSQ